MRWPAARVISPPVRPRSCARNWGATRVIVWDTGPLIAAADTDDEHHARSVALMRRTPRPLLVRYLVLTEVCFMLHDQRRVDHVYQHPNRSILAVGPEITVRPVATRTLTRGAAR
ncbi:hypothetical protein FAIPA1_210097 [Frankia sp. AiPs1]